MRGMYRFGVLAGVLALALSSATAADAAVRVKPKRAVPGQVVVISGVKAGKVRVSVGGKPAKVVGRVKRRLQVVVPKLKPGKKRVVVRQGRKRSRASLRVDAAFSGNVRPTLEPLLAASAEVGPAGGVVSARGSDGTVYDLSVPAGALAEATTITLTPVKKLDGAPVSGSPHAVQFAPDGLEFGVPASLRITLEKRAGKRTVGISYEGDGRRFTFVPAERDGNVVTVEVEHFSGGGSAEGSLAHFVWLLAQLSTNGVTVEDADAFFDAKRTADAILGDGWCLTDATCSRVLRMAIAAYENNWNSVCGGERPGTIAPLYRVLRQLLAEEAVFQLYDEPYGTPRCRFVITEYMLGLTTDTAVSDPLGISGPCEGSRGQSGRPRGVQADLDGDGTVRDVECAFFASAIAAEQAYIDLQTTGIAAFEAGLRKVLTDAELKCEARQVEEALPKLDMAIRIAAGAGAGEVLNELRAGRERCTRITVSPQNPSVKISETADFTAEGKDPSDRSFSWSVDRGSIDGAGHLTAPDEPGTIVVTATSDQHPDRKGTTTVTVTCPEGLVAVDDECREVTITIDPTSATLAPGTTQQFTATVTGPPDTRVSWSASGGSVTQAGLFTAPATAGQYTVTAASVAAPSKQATATVTVGAGKVEVLTRSSGGRSRLGLRAGEEQILDEDPPAGQGAYTGPLLGPDSVSRSVSAQAAQPPPPDEPGIATTGEASIDGTVNFQNANDQLQASITGSTHNLVDFYVVDDNVGRASAHVENEFGGFIKFRVAGGSVRISCTANFGTMPPTDNNGPFDGTIFHVYEHNGGSVFYLRFDTGTSDSAVLAPGDYNLQLVVGDGYSLPDYHSYSDFHDEFSRTASANCSTARV